MPILQDIEPMLPSEDALAKSDLPDKCITLISKAAELKGKLSTATAQVLEDHMLVINSYYSNMIEGNNTHPHDIRKAQQGEYLDNPAKRDLQLESLAHIKAQQAIAGFELDQKKLLSKEFVSFPS